MINDIIEAAVKDPPSLLIKKGEAPTEPSPQPNGQSSSTTDTSTQPSTAAPSAAAPKVPKHVLIEDRPYHIVSATLETLLLFFDYLKVVVNLSTLTTDTMGRVIEFLKAFNSRTCQVVLGAGAMRSAGLKNISAKHLGLSFLPSLDKFD